MTARNVPALSECLSRDLSKDGMFGCALVPTSFSHGKCHVYYQSSNINWFSGSTRSEKTSQRSSHEQSD
jgi:hypothetical protein